MAACTAGTESTAHTNSSSLFPSSPLLLRVRLLPRVKHESWAPAAEFAGLVSHDRPAPPPSLHTRCPMSTWLQLREATSLAAALSNTASHCCAQRQSKSRHVSVWEAYSPPSDSSAEEEDDVAEEERIETCALAFDAADPTGALRDENSIVSGRRGGGVYASTRVVRERLEKMVMGSASPWI